MGRVVGIDLGTTNSCVVVMEDGQPVVIPNTGGYKTTPSIFAVTDEGKRLVGHLAKRQAVTNARNTVYAAKRLIGRTFDSVEVVRARELLPYEVVEGPNGDTRIQIAGRVYTTSEISGIILREMKRVAEEYLDEGVEEAVITVPAYFNDSQRQMTRDSGRVAGLEVLRIINEPTAAALAYGLGRDQNEHIAVYDLGGGTFNISILQMGAGVIEVLATSGDTSLGGEDFDLRLVQYLIDTFADKEGVDLSSDIMALQRLKDAAEKAKCDLSQVDSTEINLPFIAANLEEQPLHMSMLLDRSKFEELIVDIAARTQNICEKVLQDANLSVEDIDQVLLVGGQTRTPLVQKLVTEFFGKTPHKGVHPDEVVAIGAGIQAAMLAEDQEGPLLIDVTPLSLGIATYGGHFARLIERNTKVPASRKEIFTTTRDGQTAVKVRVLQGENQDSDENDLLGEFILSGIAPGAKGECEIVVTFDIDANGIVSVSAKDLGTNKAQSIQVNPRGALSDEEVEKLSSEYAVQVKG